MMRKMKKQPNLKDEAAKKKSPDAEFDAFSPYTNRDKSNA